MKKLLITLALFSPCTWSFAQDASLAWAKQIEGPEDQSGKAVVVDAAGNIYTTGLFENATDFDPGAGTAILTSAGSWDVFVSKLDAAGNYVWAKRLGGSGTEIGNAIALDASGNVYTTGYFTDVADFDPGAGVFNMTPTASDIFISKLDAAGNFQWAKQIGGFDYDEGLGITVDAAGNFYLTGHFRDVVDFDPAVATFSMTAVGFDDVFIAKYNASGNLIWAKRIGDFGSDYGFAIRVDSFGNVYVVGGFDGLVDFDPGTGTSNLTASGLYDIFLCKLDFAGNFVWAKQLGGTGMDSGYSIALDAGGNIYVTGSFQGTADLDPSAGTSNFTSAGDYDIFIEKLNAAGDLVWARQIGDIGSDQGTAITVDIAGGVYVTGVFNGSPDFDPGVGSFVLTALGTTDMYLCKFNTAGDFVWAKQMSGSGQTVDYSIALDIDRNIITTGGFSGTADFDPDGNTLNFTANGNSDAFIQKMYQTGLGIAESDFAHALAVYPNPTTGNVTLDLEDHRHKASVALIDIHGRILETWEFKGEQVLSLRLDHPAGAYLLRVQADGRLETVPILKMQ